MLSMQVLSQQVLSQQLQWLPHQMLSQQVVLEDVLAAEDRLVEEAVGGAGAEDAQGLTMQLQMQTLKLMKVAKLTNQILMLKPIRRIGWPEVAMPCVLEGAVAFCKLGGTSNARSSKTKLTISQAEVEQWIICSQMVMESEQRPEEKGHGNDGQTQLSCGPGFQMKTRVVGR